MRGRKGERAQGWLQGCLLADLAEHDVAPVAHFQLQIAGGFAGTGGANLHLLRSWSVAGTHSKAAHLSKQQRNQPIVKHIAFVYMLFASSFGVFVGSVGCLVRSWQMGPRALAAS